MEGWPVVYKAVKQLAYKVLIGLAWLNEQFTDTVIWALDQILVEMGEAQGEMAVLASGAAWNTTT